MHFAKNVDFVCIESWDEDLYEKALSWVDETRRVAIVSDEPRVMKDPRVAIYTIESPLQWPGIMRQIGQASVFKTLQVIGSELFKAQVEESQQMAHGLLSEAADYWVKPMCNARANNLPFRRGMDLARAFEGVPAIIVGAGPSLEKNGHLLRLFEDKALIFAGGSALNAIEIEPHFAASIDAEAPYRQFKSQPFSEVPFCYQARMNPENFSLLHGERLLFPDSSCPLINEIYGESPFNAGWTVGTFLTSVAKLMGCSPILFVGMDLCYKAGKKYAKIEAESPEGLIQVGDVWTQKDWFLASRWIEAQGGEMFNAGEGILRLPKISLEQFAPTLKKQNLKSKVFEVIQKLPEQRARDWSKWEESFKNCKKNLDNMDCEIVYSVLLNPLWNIWKPIFERELIDHDLELHRKLFFQKVLEEHEQVLFKR